MQLPALLLDSFRRPRCCVDPDLGSRNGYAAHLYGRRSGLLILFNLHVATSSKFQFRRWQLAGPNAFQRQPLFFCLSFPLCVVLGTVRSFLGVFGLRAQILKKYIFFAYFCSVALSWGSSYLKSGPWTVLCSSWVFGVAWTGNALCVACKDSPDILSLF